jgi:hypothetical protein
LTEERAGASFVTMHIRTFQIMDRTTSYFGALIVTLGKFMLVSLLQEFLSIRIDLYLLNILCIIVICLTAFAAALIVSNKD